MREYTKTVKFILIVCSVINIIGIYFLIPEVIKFLDFINQFGR